MQPITPLRLKEPDTPRYITLMVALYFVLLAFFIVLVSQSQFDPPREQPVMESLQTRFLAPVRGMALTETVAPAAAPPHAELLRAFQAIFPELQDTVWQISDDPRRVEAEIAAQTLMPDADGLTPIQQEKLGQLADVWRQADPPEQLAIHSRWQQEPAADAATTRQLGELARHLQAKGLPAKALHIGLDDALPPGRLRLQLTLPAESESTPDSESPSGPEVEGATP